MFVNFSSSALSTHTVEDFGNIRNICEKLECVFFNLLFATTHLVVFG